MTSEVGFVHFRDNARKGQSAFCVNFVDSGHPQGGPTGLLCIYIKTSINRSETDACIIRIPLIEAMRKPSKGRFSFGGMFGFHFTVPFIISSSVTPSR